MMTWLGLIAIGIFGIILLWMPIMLIAALFSGWWELSRLHPKHQAMMGAKRGVGTVVFSPLFQYKRCVGYAIDDDHLHLWMPPVLGIFHPPMSIMWSAMQFPEGARNISGMALVEIDARRILVSHKIVERELAVRDHVDVLDDTPNA